MRENKLGAVVMEGGSSMFYFTGTRWSSGGNMFGLVLPASGEPAWAVATADQARAHEAVFIGTDIRTWSPEANIGSPPAAQTTSGKSDAPILDVVVMGHLDLPLPKSRRALSP